MAFILPPPKPPFFLAVAGWLIRKVTGKDLMPAQLLAWYPKAAISSAVLEGFITHQDGLLDERMMKLVRMQVSFSVGCPFCMDMNSVGWEKLLSKDELSVLQGTTPAEEVSTLSQREKLALEYTRCISGTPLVFPRSLIQQLVFHFSEREIVILATTAAQVNYWARVIQALGCPPAGFCATDFYLELPKADVG